MSDVMIVIGGREFNVSCKSGEENALAAAGSILDFEAAPIVKQMEHVSAERMLLIAGLMVADRVANLELELKEAQENISQLSAKPDSNKDTAARLLLDEVVYQVEELAKKTNAHKNEELPILKL